MGKGTAVNRRLGGVLALGGVGAVSVSAVLMFSRPAETQGSPPAAGQVGAACRPQDGYSPDYSRLEGQVRERNLAVAVPVNLLDGVPASSLPVDQAHAPLGARYCLTGKPYPKGYLTSNCNADGDCPLGTRCDGTVCRRACSTSADCIQPAVCGSENSPAGVRYCWCESCVGAERD